MSTHATIRAVHRDVTYVATSADLVQRITCYRNQGCLVSMTTPEPTGHDGKFRTVLRVRVPYDPATERAARKLNTTNRCARPGTRITVIATAITGTAAGLLTVAAYLIGQLVQLIAEHAALILAVLALAATLAVTAVRHRCSGRRHCPGC